MNIIRFLGCGSAFNPLLGNTSAYFKVENALFLIDAGETVFSKIFKMKLLENSQKIFVIITHTHGDHVGSLPSIISYVYYVLGKKVCIIHPEESLKALLDLMGISRDAYECRTDADMEIEGVSVKAVPVKHEENIKCYGYLLGVMEKKIFYSGDSYEIPQIIVDQFLSGDIDDIYQDTSEFSSERLSHCPLNTLEMLFPAEVRKNIYCMHFSNDFVKKLKNKGFNYVHIEKC